MAERDLKGCAKVDAELNDMAKCNRYFLLVLLLLNVKYFAVIDLQLDQRLVELLTLGAEEYVKEVVDDPRLSLQEDSVRQVGIRHLLLHFLFILFIVQFVEECLLEQPLLVLHLFIFALEELVDALRALLHMLEHLRLFVFDFFLLLHSQLDGANLLVEFGLGELALGVELHFAVEMLLDLLHEVSFLGLGYVVAVLIFVQLEEVVDEEPFVHGGLTHVQNLVEPEVSEILLHHLARVR